MAGAHGAEPIKLGVLMDYVMPNRDIRDDFVQPVELVFKEGLESGMIDRPVELVYRRSRACPRGNVKAVIDAFGELVDEGCLAVIGPHISDNAVAVRDEIERRFRVPAISVCGSEDWLGEWTFLLNNGSMTDEPILWAHLMAKAGQPTAGVLVERSYIGQAYLLNFRRAAHHEGMQIVAEEYIAQTGQDISAAVAALHEAGAKRSCTAASGSASPRSTTRCARSTGIRRGTWGPPSRPASTNASGTHSSGGSASSSTTRATPSDSSSSTGSKRPTGGGPSTTARCCGATGHVVPPRVRRRHAAVAAGRQGRARAGEDAARRVRLPRDAHLVREVDPPRLDGSRLPRGPDARPDGKARGSCGSPRWSVDTARTDRDPFGGDRSHRRRRTALSAAVTGMAEDREGRLRIPLQSWRRFIPRLWHVGWNAFRDPKPRDRRGTADLSIPSVAIGNVDRRTDSIAEAW